MTAISAGLSSISAGFDRLDRAATRIARDGTGDDLAASAVELLRARHDVRAGVAVVRAADEMTGTILDLFA